MEETDIMRCIQRNCVIVDQKLVVDLRQGNFLIQFIFCKDYTDSIMEILSRSAFFLFRTFKVFFSYGKSFLVPSVYIVCSYNMLLYHCISPNNLDLSKRNAWFPPCYPSQTFISHVLIPFNSSTLHLGFSCYTLWFLIFLTPMSKLFSSLSDCTL